MMPCGQREWSSPTECPLCFLRTSVYLAHSLTTLFLVNMRSSNGQEENPARLDDEKQEKKEGLCFAREN